MKGEVVIPLEHHNQIWYNVFDEKPEAYNGLATIWGFVNRIGSIMLKQVFYCVCLSALIACSFVNAQMIDFETTPDGATPLDDMNLGTNQPYMIDGVEVRFGFDSDFDGVVDTSAAFEMIGNDGVNGFEASNGVDQADTGFESQLGTWFLRSQNDYHNGVNPGVFTIQFSDVVSTVSGEVWDIDGETAYGSEAWFVRVYASDNSLLETIRSPEFTNSGRNSLDGQPWVFSVFRNEGISRVEIEFDGTKTNLIGLAFNNFTITALPGPRILCHSPDANAGIERGNGGVDSIEIAWSESVKISNNDIIVRDRNNNSVGVTVSGSNTQLTTITFDTPVFNDDYTIIILDTAVASRNNVPIDGDNDGVSGGDAILTLRHRCDGDFNADGTINSVDVIQFLNAWIAGCS